MLLLLVLPYDGVLYRLQQFAVLLFFLVMLLPDLIDLLCRKHLKTCDRAQLCRQALFHTFFDDLLLCHLRGVLAGLFSQITLLL